MRYLGLRPVRAGPDLRVFELQDGRYVEVFGPCPPGRERCDRGPVVGSAVRDLSAAIWELRNAASSCPVSWDQPGGTSRSDGNVCELVAS